jgi:hypothetical protein
LELQPGDIITLRQAKRGHLRGDFPFTVVGSHPNGDIALADEYDIVVYRFMPDDSGGGRVLLRPKCYECGGTSYYELIR